MANRREYAIPTHHRGPNPGAVLNLGSMVFHFDKLQMPVQAPAADVAAA